MDLTHKSFFPSFCICLFCPHGRCEQKHCKQSEVTVPADIYRQREKHWDRIDIPGQIIWQIPEECLSVCVRVEDNAKLKNCVEWNRIVLLKQKNKYSSVTTTDTQKHSTGFFSPPKCYHSITSSTYCCHGALGKFYSESFWGHGENSVSMLSQQC